MSEPHYSVIFRGDLIDGFTVNDVKANFARLFKAGPEAIEKLFSGRPLAIKKGLSEVQAQQLQVTLSKFGARSVVRVEGEPAGAQAAVNVSEKKATPAVAVELVEEPRPAEPGLTLAPMEGYLLKEHERSKVEPQLVPTSHLSLKPAEGNLLAVNERPSQPVVEVQVPDWKVDTVATFKLGTD